MSSHPPPAAPPLEVYRGVCDGSAAAPLDNQHFVVADDDRNILHIYRRGEENAVGEAPLEDFLGTDPKEEDGEIETDEQGRTIFTESDIEGAARVGDRIYWICSHGRDSKGGLEPGRERFFATRVEKSGGVWRIAPEGAPYRNLRADLFADPRLADLGLAATFGPPGKKNPRHAPEEDGGFNIEALAAGSAGALLIGFRNPRPGGLALLVPLLNPAELVEAGGPARFGDPVLFDLGGRGLRSIDKAGSRWLVVAGPHGDVGPASPRPPFMVRAWDGASATLTGAGLDVPPTFGAEALLVWPDGRVSLFADDGDDEENGPRCKKRPNRADRRFRAVTVAQGQ